MSESAAPPPLHRPGATPPPRRSVIQWVREEWSVVVLAALFTGVVWYLARENVLGPHVIEGVEVHEPRATGTDLQVQLLDRPARIDIHLHCSDQTYQDLRETLYTQGVQLKIGQPPKSTRRRLDAALGDEILLPSGNEWLMKGEGKTELPRGLVFKASRIKATFVPPAVAPDLAAKLEELGLALILDRMEPDHVEQVLPQGVFPEGVERTIQPDAIQLQDVDLGREPGDVFALSLRFENWIRGGGQDDAQRQAVRFPPNAYVYAHLEARAEEAVENTFVLMQPEGFSKEYDVEIRNREVSGFQVNLPRFTGTLQGTRRALRELLSEEGLRTWHWGVFLTEAGLARLKDLSETNPDVLLQDCYVDFLPHAPAQGRGVRFLPTEKQQKIELRVSLRTRDGG